eukprot:scaffold272040_cov51-Attheya_sp.AAC.1
MPHSTTKKFRPKRDDVRPNGKRRNKARLAAVEKMEAKDIITTRIPKALHKERPVTGVLRAAMPRISVEESRIRSLQKLLRQIEQLGEKKSAGGVLDAAQLEKLERLASVVFELNELRADEDGDEDEEDEQMEATGQSSDKDDEEEDELVDATEDSHEEEEKEKVDVKVKRTIQSKGNRKKKKSKTGK